MGAVQVNWCYAWKCSASQVIPIVGFYVTSFGDLLFFARTFSASFPLVSAQDTIRRVIIGAVAIYTYMYM